VATLALLGANADFERQRIIEKLNVHMLSPLGWIFAFTQWHRPKGSTDWREHPSSLVDAPRVPKIGKTPNSSNPNAALNTAKVMQARSHGLPLCPQCHCPTPAELQRWAICSICCQTVVKRISSHSLRFKLTVQILFF